MAHHVYLQAHWQVLQWNGTLYSPVGSGWQVLVPYQLLDQHGLETGSGVDCKLGNSEWEKKKAYMECGTKYGDLGMGL